MTDGNDTVSAEIKVDHATGLMITDGGLTKREYFAGLAMQGLLANAHALAWAENEDENALVSVSVQYADDLVAVLNLKKETNNVDNS